MKKTLFAAGLLAALAAPTAFADDFDVDAVHSSVMFRVKHVGVSYTYGRFNQVEGTFSFDQADASKCKVELTIRTQSVDTNNAKRDQHLKGPDFFNAEEFPVITFTSKQWTKKDDDTWTVKGDMSMHGVTKEITVDVDLVGIGDLGERFGFRAGVEAVFTIKRSDFGMNFGVDNGSVGDDVKIWLAVEGIRK